MTEKIFNREKFEAIKADVEAVRAAYHEARENRDFHRERYEKQAGAFWRGYPPHTRPFGEIYDGLAALKRTEAGNSRAYFEAESAKLLALLGDDYPEAKWRLEGLLTDLVDLKDAERRFGATVEKQKIVTAGFDVLEDFARKHIKRLGVSQVGIAPEQPFFDDMTVGDSL